MTILTYVLFMSSRMLFTGCIIFVSSCISGMGLGLGLHTIKGWIQRRKDKKQAKLDKKRAEELETKHSGRIEEFFSDAEEAIAAATKAN